MYSPESSTPSELRTPPPEGPAPAEEEGDTQDDPEGLVRLVGTWSLVSSAVRFIKNDRGLIYDVNLIKPSFTLSYHS